MQYILEEPCGSIGYMSKGKWTKNRCIEESKKYKTRSEFSVGNSNAYQKSLKEGWINEMTWLESSHNYPRGYWSIKEHIIEEASKYSTKKEFEKNNVSAFIAAHKNGWINEIDWKTKQTQHKKNYWDYEHIKEEASKYTSKTKFAHGNRAAYNAAIRLDILKFLFPKKTKIKQKTGYQPAIKHEKGYWKNKENMMAEARKYTTKEEFKKGNLTAFLAAYRYGYIDEMDWLVTQKQHKKKYWTYEHIEEEALKYDTKTDFFKGSQTAYRAALKMGIIDDFFSFNDYVE